MELPTLYKLGKNKEVRYWECKVEGDTFYTRYGLLKTRDTHKWYEHIRSARYEPGHGAYASAEDVALEHGQSLWSEKKRNDAMSEEIPNPDGPMGYPVPVAPVLATRYDKLKERHDNGRSRYSFPEDDAYVQYKLDGERCICSWVQEKDGEGNLVGDPGARLFSRLRSEIPHLDHIKQVMSRIYTIIGKKYPSIYGFHFDGEVLIPGNTRNTMRSAISRVREKHTNNEAIVYYIFDIITTVDMPFSDRWGILNTIMAKVKSKHVKLIPLPTTDKGDSPYPMVSLTDDDRIMDLLGDATSNGYEGIILRTQDMPYPVGNHRIPELIKVKPLHDEEYRIIGCTEAKDKEKGLIIFEMQDMTCDYITFTCRPAWSYADRKEAWGMHCDDPTTFIGRLGTVLYECKSEYGVPQNVRMTRLRDKEDMDPSL